LRSPARAPGVRGNASQLDARGRGRARPKPGASTGSATGRAIVERGEFLRLLEARPKLAALVAKIVPMPRRWPTSSRAVPTLLDGLIDDSASAAAQCRGSGRLSSALQSPANPIDVALDACGGWSNERRFALGGAADHRAPRPHRRGGGV
jgi:hypothetical protein